MAGKVEQRRDALRRTLVDLAEARVAEGGIAAVKARDLAQQAGCALGAIYNVFDDLNDIVLAVNGRTFEKFGNAVAQSLEGKDSDSPKERMLHLSYAYMRFAEENPKTWRVLFEIEATDTHDVPDWYKYELRRLFEFIEEPVRECFPDTSNREVTLISRTLFSAIHGIVLLGLENRISAVPREHMMQMIKLIIEKIAANR